MEWAAREGAFGRAMRGLAFVALCLVVSLPAAAQHRPDRREAVAERVARGDDAGALAMLERRRPRDAAHRYLYARLLERAGRYADAAEAFPIDGAAAGLPEAIATDSRRRRAEMLARSGRCDRARAIWRGDGAPLSEARAAECALASGDLDAAVAELRAVVERGHAAVDLFAARLQLAEALVRTDARDEARRVLTDLVVDRVEHPEIARAEAALAVLSDGAPTFTFEQRMDRVDRLMEVRRHDDALTELEAIGRPRDRERLRRWLHTKGMALYSERHHYAEAAEVLTESARLRGAHAGADAFHAARALSRDDQDREAARRYRAFARQHRGHPRVAEALFLASWLELRLGVRGAERRMQQFLDGPHGRGGFARDATWQLALAAFVDGDHRDAERRFTRYAELSADPLVRARGIYWRGRAQQARGARAAAIASYREALHVEPLHWYALLARQRLVALGETEPPIFEDPPEAGASAPPDVELPEPARTYASLGLLDDAREAVRAHESSLREAHGERALAEVYRQLEAPNRLVRLYGGPATTRRSARPGPADRWRWDAAYPRPWAARVAEAARAVDLTPGHLYAIMRQESGYEPSAVSYADAIGLMQLLLRAAERVAEGLGQTVAREDLFDPGTNVRLGATYVGGLVERYGVPLAFAAYNGGGHNVDAWLRESGRTELDLFVEQIPFTQTRNYVRRVTTHLAHYLYLDDPDGGWPLELPTHVEPATPD